MAGMFGDRSTIVEKSVRPQARPEGLTSMFGDRSMVVSSTRPQARPEQEQTVVEQQRQAVEQTIQQVAQAETATAPATQALTDVAQQVDTQQTQTQVPERPELNFDFLLPDQQVHEVKSGDTLDAIVSQGDYTLSDLLAINPQIEDPSKLSIGQKVYIPMEGQYAVPYKVSSYTASQSGDILDFISKGEGKYSSSNRGTKNDDIIGATHETMINGTPLTEATIGDIKQAQREGLFAVGRYQFIPSTLRIVVDQLGIPDDAVFTPELQDRMGLQLLMGSKRPKLAAFLRGEDVPVDTAMLEFAKEWASVPDPRTGKSYYGNGNKALHTVEETKAILESAREVFSKEQ